MCQKVLSFHSIASLNDLDFLSAILFSFPGIKAADVIGWLRCLCSKAKLIFQAYRILGNKYLPYY